VCNEVLINVQLKIGKRCKEIELTGRNPYGWRRSALDPILRRRRRRRRDNNNS